MQLLKNKIHTPSTIKMINNNQIGDLVSIISSS